MKKLFRAIRKKIDPNHYAIAAGLALLLADSARFAGKRIAWAIPRGSLAFLRFLVASISLSVSLLAPLILLKVAFGENVDPFLMGIALAGGFSGVAGLARALLLEKKARWGSGWLARLAGQRDFNDLLLRLGGASGMGLDAALAKRFGFAREALESFGFALIGPGLSMRFSLLFPIRALALAHQWARHGGGEALVESGRVMALDLSRSARVRAGDVLARLESEKMEDEIPRERVGSARRRGKKV